MRSRTMLNGRETRWLAATVALLAGLAATPAAAAGNPRKATRARVESRGTATRVVVTFSEPPSFSARIANGGKRLIVDVPDSVVAGAPAALTERRGPVGGTLVQSYDSGGSKLTRVLVNLLEDAPHAVRVEGNDLVIAFGEAPRTAALKEPTAPLPTVEPRIEDVRYRHDADADRVVIQLSEGAAPELTQNGAVASLRLAGAKLPPALRRVLDVSEFHGRVARVATWHDAESKSVRLEAALESGVQSRIERQGARLVWTFFRPSELPSSVTGIARDGGAARRSRTVAVETGTVGIPAVSGGFPEDVAASGIAAEEASAFVPGLTAQTAPNPAAAGGGRRIDLDLKDADILNVLRLIADVGRVNVVAADNVKGSVTIRLRNVPWEQALNVILQAKKLGMVREANMLRVAPLEELQKERDMRLARARQELELAPLETRIIPLSYALANQLQERGKELLSSRGSISVETRTNALLVRDVAANVAQIEELLRALDTQTPQVLIEARIVEATSRYLRDVGIQWGGDGTFSQATGNPTGLAFPNKIGFVGGASDTQTPTAGLSPFRNTVANPNFGVNLPAAVGTGTGGALGLNFGSVDNTVNLALRLSAAEASGMLRIVSSPRILTLDHVQARISQGTLIPFSQISAQGVQTQFQEAKLQLLVLPHVTADGSVMMHVKINRDEPDFNQTSARGDPTILKREAETEMMVQDGHTAVIGGIFTRNTGRNLDQVPLLGDIPILGLLFQRRRASDTRSELVIFITPRVVNRAEAFGR